MITFYPASNIVSRNLCWVECGHTSTRSASEIAGDYARRYASDVNIPNIDNIDLNTQTNK